MRGILLACVTLVPALMLLGGCDSKKITTIPKTVEAPKDQPAGPGDEGDATKKDKEVKGKEGK